MLTKYQCPFGPQRFEFEAPLKTTVVPNRGTGAASFTRATVATVKDFEGNIRNVLSGEVRFEGQRRVRNYVREDVTLWPKAALGTGVLPVVTAGQTDPNGTATAYRVQLNRGAGTTAGDYSFLQDGSGTGMSLGCSSLWIKSNTGSSQVVSLRIATGNAMNITATTSWQRLSPPVNNVVYMDIGTQGNLATSAAVDVLVWRPQLESKDNQSNQNPSEYVSVGAAKLNEVTYTEEQDNAAYTKVGLTVTANATTDSYGNATYEKLIPNNLQALGTGCRINCVFTPLANETYVCSFEAKAGELNRVGVAQIGAWGVTAAVSANFDLVGGTVIAGSHASATITDLGNGCYRCSVTITSSGTPGTGGIQLMPVDSVIVTGDGVKGMYCGKWQIARSSQPTTYFPVGNVYPYHGACVDGVKYFDYQNSNTVSSNVVTEGTTRTPCLGYTSGSWTNSAEGYLPEGASTNLVLQSSNFGTTWSGAGTTPTRSAAAKYCGDIALDLIGDDDAGVAELYAQNITFTGDGAKSFSVVVAQGTSTSTLLRMRDTPGAADRFLGALTWSSGVPVLTVTTGSQERPPEVLANGCYRVFCLCTGVVAASTNTLQIWPATTTGFAVANTGNIYCGGVQAENATVASSLQPTTTATVARNADVLTWPGAGNVSATEGTIYAEARFDRSAGASQVLCELGDTTANERMTLYRASSGNMTFDVVDGGVAQASLNLGAAANNTLHKVAVRYKSNDFAGSLNGAAVVTDTAGTLPTVTTIYAGVWAAGAQASSPMKNLRIAQTALTDGYLAAMTA